MRRALAFVAIVVTSSGAAAADESSSAAAAALFKEGRAFLQQGRYADACERLARSDRLEPSVGARLSLGECHEGLGENASAWAAYNQASSLAMQKGDDARAEIAKKRVTWLEPHLARLIVHVAPGTPGIVVVRNGARIDPAAFDTTMPVDAGRQVLEATAPDHEPWRTTIEIRDGESKAVAVPALASDGHAPRAGATPHRPRESDPRRTLALGLEVGGSVAVVTGLVFGLVAMTKWSSIEDACPDAHCATDRERDRRAPDVSTARTLSIASTITTGLGLVALAAGVYLHLTVVPLADRDTAGAALVGRF